MLSLSAASQTIGEAFYIYRNDGHFNAFFREEVDSMTFIPNYLKKTEAEEKLNDTGY